MIFMPCVFPYLQTCMPDLNGRLSCKKKRKKKDYAGLKYLIVTILISLIFLYTVLFLGAKRNCIFCNYSLNDIS